MVMDLSEGAVIANRFRLVRLLGKGGMGEVWAAQHTSLDIPCAVKFIHAESAEKVDVRTRFEREAKAAAQLRSPNVVQILDYGVFDNTPYIAMEYLEGEPLNVRLKRRRVLDAHETYRIVAGVGKALGKAHVAGIVHRDLKPENVFLVPDDDTEVAKVLDFGVAKHTATLDSNTKTGALLGTPYYMSPEQAQGVKAVDHRADLWSLAVLTYRCLTGELPFKSQALGDLLIKIVTGPVSVPSHVAPQLPEGFDGWWLRAAERDPDRRFQSAKEMVGALGLALNVTSPSQFGNTPMPGALYAPQPMSAPAQTMIADPVTGVPLGTPFVQSGASQSGSYPSHGLSMPHARSHMPSVHGAPSGAHAFPGHQLGDSSGGSVAGFAAGPHASHSSHKVALAGVLSLVALGIGAGAFLFFRDAPSEAQTPAAATVSDPNGVAPPAESDEVASDVPKPADSSETPAASAAVTDLDDPNPDDVAPVAKPPQPGMPIIPSKTSPPESTPSAQPSAAGPPTDLGVPTPTPAKTYDPGF